MKFALGLLMVSILAISSVSGMDLSADNLVFEDKFDNASKEIESYNYATSSKDTNVQQWKIESGKLIADDFSNGGAGAMIYLINNETYSDNYTILVDVFREEYVADWDAIGIVVGYKSPTDYYYYSMSNCQYWFVYRGDGYSRTIKTSLNPEGLNFSKTNMMQITVFEEKVQLVFDGNIIADFRKEIPSGKIGFYRWDGASGGDSIDGSTSFDNLKVYAPPKVTTIINGNFYNTTVESVQPIKEIEFIVEEETIAEMLDASGFAYNKSTYKILQSNITEYFEKDNVTIAETVNEYIAEVPKQNIIVIVYYKITDWLGGLFKSDGIKI